MKISTLSVLHCGIVENDVTEDEVLIAGMDEKSKEFVEVGEKIYLFA